MASRNFVVLLVLGLLVMLLLTLEVAAKQLGEHVGGLAQLTNGDPVGTGFHNDFSTDWNP
ncbi:hypothetical protein Dsin_000578 [Dipteronia sinensis]|uniref:Uncharacterized protein n=1 Tax=Dipteronia sinensis TaxID=43782 RepID=A0AAE0EI61_9ROSI|nr:hypothetical protein Dsin_000578 [Dipteronia sinensis]